MDAVERGNKGRICKFQRSTLVFASSFLVEAVGLTLSEHHIDGNNNLSSGKNVFLEGTCSDGDVRIVVTDGTWLGKLCKAYRKMACSISIGIKSRMLIAEMVCSNCGGKP